MKKLLEKPWAKALAFLLTLLPGTAAVYGGVELVYIYVYNMHTDRRLDMLWAVTAVCAVAAAASLVFSLSAAGHWPGHEGIHLTWVEKIPVDLFVLGLTCVWYIYLDAVYYPSATLGLAVFVALAYLFVLAFTARCKAGTVLSDLLALRLLRLLSRGAVWTWRHLRRCSWGWCCSWAGRCGRGMVCARSAACSGRASGRPKMSSSSFCSSACSRRSGARAARCRC